jgi:hypothetical protein
LNAVDTLGLKFDFAADPLCRVANPEMPDAVVAHDGATDS